MIFSRYISFGYILSSSVQEEAKRVPDTFTLSVAHALLFGYVGLQMGLKVKAWASLADVGMNNLS